MDYFNIYKDVWNFHKRYCNEQITEDSLEEAIRESKEIHKKYNKSKFVKDLLVTVLNELDRTYKETGADANKRIS